VEKEDGQMLRSAIAIQTLAAVFWLALNASALSEETTSKAKAPAKEVTGRAVLESNPEQGVPFVDVVGFSEDMQKAAFLHATSDSDGNLRGKLYDHAPLEGPLFVKALSKDQSLGLVQRFKTLDNLTLKLSPTAAIHGTVLDDETGDFARIRAVKLNLLIRDGTSIEASETVTGSGGYFRLVGLVPGQEYQLCIATEFKDGKADFPIVAVVKPESAKEINLDVLHIPKIDRPPTFEEFVASRYLDKPPEERLKYGVNVARLASIRLLMIAAERDSEAAKQFYGFIYPYAEGISRDESRDEFFQTFRQFIPLSLAPGESQEFLTWHGIKVPGNDGATFAVFSGDGRVIEQISFDEFQSEGQFSTELFAEFLRKHLHPPLGNARELLDEALVKAKKENKRVFVQTGGPGCGPCVILAEFLEKHEAMIEKDYVNIKFDTRMESFMEVYEKLTAGEARGAPWMTILDAGGETLITGDDEEGNIGFPTEESEIAQFKKMFASTKQTISDQEIDDLVQSLREAGKELLSKQEK
jgi:hypothetical protein